MCLLGKFVPSNLYTFGFGIFERFRKFEMKTQYDNVNVRESREQMLRCRSNTGSNANVGSGPVFWDDDQTGC